MNQPLLWITAAFGFVALIGFCWRMKPGFGPQNIDALGIAIVATFAALLGIVQE